jgi:hypothetical protein
VAAPNRRRALPWVRAGLASTGLHLAALIALASVASTKFARTDRGGDGEPLMAVALVGPFSRAQDAAQPAGVARRRPAQIAEAVNLGVPIPSGARPSAPPVGGLGADRGPDADGVFRAPFRDSKGQAEASLRGGQACAHVDLKTLPDDLRELCKTAIRWAGPLATVTPTVQAEIGEFGNRLLTRELKQTDARRLFGPSSDSPKVGHAGDLLAMGASPRSVGQTGEARDEKVKGPGGD